MKISDKLLQVQGLHKTYGKGQNETSALKGITFDVLQGEFLGIMVLVGQERPIAYCIATMLRPTSDKYY